MGKNGFILQNTPYAVVITYTLNWLKMSTLHVTRAQSCDKNSKFYYECKVVKRVQTLYSARTMSKFRLSWVLYELHLRYGVMQFSCVWKIYSRSLTPNYIRNNVITLTKLLPLSLRSTWFNYTCWRRKSLFLSKYGKKSLIISVDMIFEIVHDVSSCSCKWVTVWASLPRITTGQWKCFGFTQRAMVYGVDQSVDRSQG